MSRERRLFRWCGSKHHLAPRIAPMIRAHLEQTGGKLVSLFYGGGAIEQVVGLPGARQVAADACDDLRGLYASLDWGAEDVWRAVHELDRLAGRSRAGYMRVRASLPPSQDGRAARFIYLLSLAYNGLWRVNSVGSHNVAPDPGRLKKREPFPPLELYEETRRLTRGIRFYRDWTEAAREAQAGDVVLADPPYGDFDAYTPGGFSARDHRLLASCLRQLFKTGCAIIAFNGPGAETLYHWAKVEEVFRSGRISCKADGREDVAELLITAGLRAAARAVG